MGVIINSAFRSPLLDINFPPLQGRRRTLKRLHGCCNLSLAVPSTVITRSGVGRRQGVLELEMQLTEATEKRQQLMEENSRLMERLEGLEEGVEGGTLSRYKDLKKKIDSLQDDLFKVETSRDEYRGRVEQLEKEHAEILQRSEELQRLADQAHTLQDEAACTLTCISSSSTLVTASFLARVVVSSCSAMVRWLGWKLAGPGCTSAPGEASLMNTVCTVVITTACTSASIDMMVSM
ncbi:Hook-related protein family [Trinorchestia longiramus]|nr:Hook-related protein family [Trinorchestia longiramus]